MLGIAFTVLRTALVVWIGSIIYMLAGTETLGWLQLAVLLAVAGAVESIWQLIRVVRAARRLR